MDHIFYRAILFVGCWERPPIGRDLDLLNSRCRFLGHNSYLFRWLVE